MTSSRGEFFDGADAMARDMGTVDLRHTVHCTEIAIGICPSRHCMDIHIALSVEGVAVASYAIRPEEVPEIIESFQACIRDNSMLKKD